MTHRPLIVSAADRAGISADLVEALVIVESGGNPYAWNPEPRYRYVVNARTGRPFRKLTDEETARDVPPTDFPALAGDRDQEWWGQRASWGLMQVMGAVAREQGFREPYLPQLCDPIANLAIGTLKLRSDLLWADGRVKKALAAYNAGRGGWKSAVGTAYAEKVVRALVQVEDARR
jgi:soluble lytic murein transglycosylase-like protein